MGPVVVRLSVFAHSLKADAREAMMERDGRQKIQIKTVEAVLVTFVK